MRNLLLILALSFTACNCEPTSPDLVFDNTGIKATDGFLHAPCGALLLV